MRRSGELVQWNNRGGYGFVRDAVGRDFYVHISALRKGQSRPHPGDRLSFEVATGRKGRLAATNVTVCAAAPRIRTLDDIKRVPAHLSRYRIGLRVAIATLMAVLIVLAITSRRAPLWLGAIYALMGLGSALLYRFDKLYALNGRWRVNEVNMHVVDLLFGIVGGLVGQEIYRHKTIKPRFVASTWAIALAHVLGLAALDLGWVSAALPGV